MMLTRLSITFLFTFLYFLPDTFAQAHSFCGTSSADLEVVRERLIVNKEYLKDHAEITNRRNKVTTYVPIKFHLVGENDGSNRISTVNVLDQLCVLNEVFSSFDFQFFIHEGLNIVDNTDIFDSPGSGRGTLDMQVERDRRALNIWILGDASTSNNTSEGIVLGYYDPVFDWVVVNKNFVNGNGYTLIHELGHFFSLLHPFHGWGDEGAPPYDASYEGKPAPLTAPDPGYSRDPILTEYADGSNCEVAGDMICDTPADYLYFTEINHAACRYDRPMLDPRGERLNPDPSLIMGYFLDNCMDHFTEDQVNLMKADLQNNDRSHLRNGNTPSVQPITNNTTLRSPIDRVVTPNYNQVQLNWNATPHATRYFIEVDRVPSFSTSSFTFTTSNTSLVIENLLEPDKNYFWRVRPYNEANTCAASSSAERFRTGLSTSVPTINSVNNWEIYPNPITDQKVLTLTVHATTSFEASLRIMDVSGRTVLAKSSHTFEAGLNQLSLNTVELVAGLYYIQLQNADGILNKKLVIN